MKVFVKNGSSKEQPRVEWSEKVRNKQKNMFRISRILIKFETVIFFAIVVVYFPSQYQNILRK